MCSVRSLQPALVLSQCAAFATVLGACSGCGGGDGPRPGDSDVVLVRLRISSGFAQTPAELQVYRDGRCTVSTLNTWVWDRESVGWFETTLTGRELRALVKAVTRAARAGLKEQYDWPPPGIPPLDVPEWYWIDLPDGTRFRTVQFPSRGEAMPEVLRPLCAEDGGLLIQCLQEAMRRPASAVALSLILGKRTYVVGEPLDVRFVIRSVGSQPVAFGSLECREVVAGEAALTATIPRVGYVIREVYSFGGRPSRPHLHALTPRAREDLEHMLLLSPGEEYVVPFPRQPVTATRAVRQLKVFALVDEASRYDHELLSQELGAPWVTGHLSDTAEIDVHDGP